MLLLLCFCCSRYRNFNFNFISFHFFCGTAIRSWSRNKTKSSGNGTVGLGLLWLGLAWAGPAIVPSYALALIVADVAHSSLFSVSFSLICVGYFYLISSFVFSSFLFLSQLSLLLALPLLVLCVVRFFSLFFALKAATAISCKFPHLLPLLLLWFSHVM